MSHHEAVPRKRGKKLFPPMSDEEQVEPPSFSLATLGLQRVGTEPPPKPKPPAQPVQKLNARGMPARARKRNRLYYDDNIINDDKPLRNSLSPRKTPVKTSTPVSSPVKTPLQRKRRLTLTTKRTTPVAAPLTVEKKVTTPTTPTKSSTSHVSKASSLNTTPKSTSRTATPRKILPTVATPDKSIGHSIGMRLRNLLKLPKAHKWVICEWFYSFVDKPLFYDQNDFQSEIAMKFQGLKCVNMHINEWRLLRTGMGKVRRSSPAWFESERRELERKRKQLRYVQTRRSGEIKDTKLLCNLPDKIPLPLPVGTKVTARLRTPQDGIFGGTVDAFDSVGSTYRVTFDRPGLSTHNVPDYEILSENFNEMLPLQSFAKDFRPNMMFMLNGGMHAPTPSSPNKGLHSVRSALNLNLNKSDPLLGQEVIESPYKNPILSHENVNGYDMKLLQIILRIRGVFKSKKAKLDRLCELNCEAEMRKPLIMRSPLNPPSEDGTQPAGMTEEFQRRYASVVISIERVNRDMQAYLTKVQAYSRDLSRDPVIQAMLAPSYLREKCREEADSAVERNVQGALKNECILELIKGLATILIVASRLGDGKSSDTTKTLDGCIEEVRSNLSGSNVEIFQKHVQLHLHHIRLGIGHNMLANSLLGHGMEH